MLHNWLLETHEVLESILSLQGCRHQELFELPGGSIDLHWHTLRYSVPLSVCVTTGHHLQWGRQTAPQHSWTRQDSFCTHLDPGVVSKAVVCLRRHKILLCLSAILGLSVNWVVHADFYLLCVVLGAFGITFFMQINLLLLSSFNKLCISNSPYSKQQTRKKKGKKNIRNNVFHADVWISPVDLLTTLALHCILT